MSRSLALQDRPGRPLVVDSWRILEWVYGREPTSGLIRERLEAAGRGDIHLLVGRITLGELTYNVRRRQRLGEFIGAMPDFSVLPWTIVSVDDLIVDEAAELKSIYPISYADCFVAALGRRYSAPVITGDPDFQRLATAGVITLDWIGA